jgi:hypothetical protein
VLKRFGAASRPSVKFVALLLCLASDGSRFHDRKSLCGVSARSSWSAQSLRSGSVPRQVSGVAAVGVHQGEVRRGLHIGQQGAQRETLR